jgi:hypothetical protein
MERITRFTTKEQTDTGLALVLILIMAAWYFQNWWMVLASGIACFFTILWPRVFSILTRIWFGFSFYMGLVMTTVILTLIYFLMVSPLGWLKNLFNKDALSRNLFIEKKSSLIDHKISYSPSDLENPF